MAVAANLFGNQVFLREPCRCNGKAVESKFPCYANLYVRVTDNCPCGCQFCEFHECRSNGTPFANDTFRRMLEILKERVRINKIVFTGGEPATAFPAFLKALQDTRDFFPDMHISVNTNGMFLNALGSSLDLLSCVALSRHHHDDYANSEIFGVREDWPSSTESIEGFPDKDKLHLRCNLIKGYIDDEDSVRRYMTEMSKLGVCDFGFVSLMRINRYCETHYVGRLRLWDLPDTYMSKEWTKTDGPCTCRNYVHLTGSGHLVKFYDRIDEDHSRSYGTLVFDVGRLRDGFGGPVILNGP